MMLELQGAACNKASLDRGSGCCLCNEDAKTAVGREILR